MIRLKENDVLNKIDSLIDKNHDDLLSIEYEVHQILGNLSTYLMLKNDKNLFLIPKTLDNQINFLSQQ